MKMHLQRMLNAMTWADARGGHREHFATEPETLPLFGHVLAARRGMAQTPQISAPPPGPRCRSRNPNRSQRKTRGTQAYLEKLNDSDLSRPGAIQEQARVWNTPQR